MCAFMQNRGLWVKGGGRGWRGPAVTVTLAVKRLCGVSGAAVGDRTRFGGEPGQSEINHLKPFLSLSH